MTSQRWQLCSFSPAFAEGWCVLIKSSGILEQTHPVNSSESDDYICNQLMVFSPHCGMGLSGVHQVLTSFTKLKMV